MTSSFGGFCCASKVKKTGYVYSLHSDCVFLFVLLSAFIITMIQPTLFPDTNIGGFKDGINIVNTLFGIVSAALAIYSLYASTKSSDDLKKALRESEERLIKEVDGIKNHQMYDKNTPSAPKRGDSPDNSNN